MVASQAQSFTISRRALDVEDYIDIARRHVGWVAGPAFAGLVVSVVVAFLLPNTYTSKATMQITPAQISDAMVQSTITTQLNDQINQMQTNIMSRTSLSMIIQDPRLNLYETDRKTRVLDDVIEDMKKDIVIRIVALQGANGRRASAFDITFSYTDRFKAQATVQSLISKFQEQNASLQTNQQAMVKGLVGDELTKGKAELDRTNDDLTKFKQENAGKLPEQVPLNIAQENNLTGQIGALTEQIYRDNNALQSAQLSMSQLKMQLLTLDDDEAQTQAIQPNSPAALQDRELAKLDQQIQDGEFQLSIARKSYTANHPEIKNLVKLLGQYQVRRDQVAEQIAQKAASEAAKPPAPPKKVTNLRVIEQRRNIEAQMAQLELSVKLVKADVEKKQEEQEKFKQESEAVSDRMKASTVLEAEYTDKLRSQKMAEENYEKLLNRQQIADESSQVIQRKAGEQLEVLDPANLPVAPAKPSRPLIIGAGSAMSVILGLLFAGLKEAKDTSLKNLKDVRAYTNLPVLCSIPLLENTMLVKRKRRLAYLYWSAAVILGAAAVVSSIVYYTTVTLKT